MNSAVKKNPHDTQKVIQINDVHFEEGTDQHQNLRVNLRNFKHCIGQSKTLLLTMDNSDVICPVSSRLNYLKLAGHNSGPLFSVSRGNSRYCILFQSTFKTAIAGSWFEFRLLQRK